MRIIFFNIISAAHILFDDSISLDHVIVVYATDKHIFTSKFNQLDRWSLFGSGFIFWYSVLNESLLFPCKIENMHTYENLFFIIQIEYWRIIIYTQIYKLFPQVYRFHRMKYGPCGETVWIYWTSWQSLYPIVFSHELLMKWLTCPWKNQA